MTGALFGVAMDFLVLLALGATIYYTIHLTKSLNAFRAHREALQGVVAELSRNIDEAHRAITALKKAGNTEADNLEGVLHDARKMADELRLINQAGNNLAGRLEKLAAGQGRPQGGFVTERYEIHEEAVFEAPSRSAVSGSVEMPSFFIQDREFEEEEPAVREPESERNFSSQAEKDLYEALRKNKNRSGGGAV